MLSQVSLSFHYLKCFGLLNNLFLGIGLFYSPSGVLNIYCIYHIGTHLDILRHYTNTKN